MISSAIEINSTAGSGKESKPFISDKLFTQIAIQTKPNQSLTRKDVNQLVNLFREIEPQTIMNLDINLVIVNKRLQKVLIPHFIRKVLHLAVRSANYDMSLNEGILKENKSKILKQILSMDSMDRNTLLIQLFTKQSLLNRIMQDRKQLRCERLYSKAKKLYCALTPPAPNINSNVAEQLLSNRVANRYGFYATSELDWNSQNLHKPPTSLHEIVLN